MVNLDAPCVLGFSAGRAWCVRPLASVARSATARAHPRSFFLSLRSGEAGAVQQPRPRAREHASADAAGREREVLETLGRLDDLWDELFPAEQMRILRLLVEGIYVAPDGIDVRLRIGGIHNLVGELNSEGIDGSAARAEALTEEAAA